MSELSARNGLPLLEVGQAGKEITHNEALLLVDALLHPVAESQQADPPTGLSPADAGQCWIVGENPSAEWAGHAQELAYWTGSGWRFAAPAEGAEVLRRDTQVTLLRAASSWHDPAVVPDPQGGAVVDAQARDAIALILAELRIRGVIG